MELTLEDLAGRVGGEAVGRAGTRVAGLRPIDLAEPGHLSPLLRRRALDGAPVLPGAVLASVTLAREAIERGVGAALSHLEPALALARLIDVFYPEERRDGAVHPSATVAPAAEIHPSAWIGPGAVIEEGVVVGEGAWVGPNAVICSGSTVGRFARIGPGAVIGHEGFGFVPTPDGPVKVRQVGTVAIGDFAEIGACACVDRGTLGPTVIGRGSKLDNLVQVGHNARVGERVLVAGQTGLAGSTVVGDDAMIGGQVGVGDHVEIGDRARIAGRSGVIGDVPEGAEVAGYPALPRVRWLRAAAALSALGDSSTDREGEET